LRERWTSRTIFLLAAISSAIGLGNVWRFPYLAHKFGGGAFLIPYLICLLIIGVPMLVLEFAIGEKLQQGAVGSFRKINKRLSGIGFVALFSGFVISIYYVVIIAWSVLYMLRSFTAKLPWADNASTYFFTEVLHLSKGIETLGGINWPIFFVLLLVWVIILLSVWEGSKSLGKVVLVTTPLPIILLTVLFIRGITLEGSLAGIIQYIRPDFAALLDPNVWAAAASQIFFTMSVGMGIMIAYSSFNKSKMGISKNSFITALFDSGVSIFAGFVVFAVLGYMAYASGSDVSSVVTEGPGLAFVIFPKALSLMPGAAWLFSILFFLMLFLLGLGSAFSLAEAVIISLSDRFKKLNKHVIAFIVCFVAFLFGIIFTTGAGLYLLDIVDHFITGFGLVFAGILECIAIGWIYGADKLRKYINEVSEVKLSILWEYSIKYVIPLVLTVILVQQFITEITTNYSGYPDWAIWIGWVVVIIPVVVAVLLAIFPGKE